MEHWSLFLFLQSGSIVILESLKKKINKEIISYKGNIKSII
jgi:hypothetical protein